MKDKITSILRHFFTGFSMLAVDAGLIGKEDAESIVRLTAAAAAIILSRIIIWLLGKINFSQFFDELKNGSSQLLMISAMSILAFGFTSCAALDIMVDKSQLKAESDTHAIYPSSAVTPLVNSDQINTVIQEGIDRANESLSNYAK